ncbi:MAG: hypothetical protein QNJ72_23050 [Pleurocapsa sp. MO_226.B13]|nr:hypothetical protein [Pleurocapsa sp. MO_226.B13]
MLFLFGCSSNEAKALKQEETIDNLISQKPNLKNYSLKIERQINSVRDLLKRDNRENEELQRFLEKEGRNLKIQDHAEFLKQAETNIQYRKIASSIEKNAFLDLRIKDLEDKLVKREIFLDKLKLNIWKIERIAEIRGLDISIDKNEIEGLIEIAEDLINEELNPKTNFDINELARDKFFQLVSK